MTPDIAKCGCDCQNCPTFKENISTKEQRNTCSAGWVKYINIKLSPEKLRPCDGCSIPDSERKVYYLNCKIRKCAKINDIENCAFCAEFPCKELSKVHSLQQIDSREAFIKKTGKEISEADYNRFIEPYAGLHHLETIRQSLKESDYKDCRKFSTKSKFATLKNNGNLNENYRKIYSLLTSISIEKDIPYARMLALESKREQLLKILWTVLYFGTFDGDKYIELDSKTFMLQKVQGMYNTLLEYFEDFKKYGVHGEIIPQVTKGWLTPMGGLRKEGWKIRLSFGNNRYNADTLKAFKELVQKLNAKYGNKAFRAFSRADLSVLTF